MALFGDKPRDIASMALTDFNPARVNLADLTPSSVRQKQVDAASLLELVPEVRFALDSVSKTAGRADVVLTGAAAVDTWERLTATRTEAEVLRILVGALWSVGEVFLVARTDDEIEIFPATDIVIRNKTMGVYDDQNQFEPFPEGATVKRVYIPDPLHPDQPTSALFAVLPDARTLLALTKLVRSIASTRSLTGILLFPSEAILTHHDDEGSITEDLHKSLSRPLECDHISAVPVMLEMDSAYIDKVKHLQLNPEIERSIPELIESITRRIAIGLEFPEPLLRAEEANHLEQWAASNALISGIVEPLLVTIAEGFTRGFVEPNDVEASIEFDVTGLARPSDQTGLIIDAYRIGLINKGYAVAALGLPPEAVDETDRGPNVTTPNIPRRQGEPSDADDTIADRIISPA